MAADRSRERAGHWTFADWQEPAAKRPSVDRVRLVREALALLDEGGFDGLTMRRLAERLGVQAASLYNHVRDKLELLALLADAICGEVAMPDPERPWREQLEDVARDYRRVLLAHWDAARALVATPPVGPRRLRLIDATLGVLRAAGFADAEAADAAVVFNAYVVGFVLDETQALPAGDLADIPADKVGEQFARWFRSLPADRYPNIAALADHLLDADAERRFEFGLRSLLDGWESRLTHSERL